MSTSCDALQELPPALQSLLAEAREAERAGRRPRARELFERILHELPHGDVSRFAAALLRWIGRTWFDDGDLDAAGDCYEAALSIAETMGDEACAAHAVNMIAGVCWRRGAPDEAEKLYLRGLELGTRGGDRTLVAMIEQNLGIIANMQGDFQGALRRYTASLDGYRTLGLTSYIAPLLNNLGMLHTHRGRWRLAGRAYAEALAACARTGDVSTRIMIEVNRTELHIAQRDWATARTACDSAHALMRQSGDTRGLGETHKQYGVIAREQQRFEEASDHLRDAMRIAVQTQDHLLTAETAREFAELFWRMRRNSESLRWLTHAHRLFAELRARRDLADVGARVERLEQFFLTMVKDWGESIESKDRYTRGHCERVAEYACALAASLGYDPEQLFWFRLGAFLHDVGKLSVPSEILNKPGQLTDEERLVVEGHPLAGVELLSDTDFPADIVPMVRSHHERWDGHGYPDRLRGEDIPLAARILCVADVYDALTTDRPYRRGYERPVALRIMSDEVGRVFDPAVFAAFVRLGSGLDSAAQVTPSDWRLAADSFRRAAGAGELVLTARRLPATGSPPRPALSA